MNTALMRRYGVRLGSECEHYVRPGSYRRVRNQRTGSTYALVRVAVIAGQQWRSTDKFACDRIACLCVRFE